MNVSDYADTLEITIPTPDFEFNELGNGSDFQSGASAPAPALTLVNKS